MIRLVTISVVCMLLLSVALACDNSDDPASQENTALDTVPRQEYDLVVQRLNDADERIAELEAQLTSTPTPSPAVRPSPTATVKKDPEPLKRWSGSGMQTTESFTVTKAPWSIVWACSTSSEYGGYFGAYVNDRSGNLVSIVGNVVDSDSGYSMVYETGTYYLEINSYGCHWTVSIQ